MKNIYVFLFSLFFVLSKAQTLPNCNSFYGQGSTIVQSSLGIPNTATVTTIPNLGAGLAIGPSFGFPAPNPTFWTTSGGNYFYWNGTAWINSGHSTGVGTAVNPGGSKNYIYNIVGGTGQVWRYDGTGPGTLLATIPALAGGGPYDLVGDDQDNFYYLRANPPQALQVYDKFGVLTCTYAVTGLAPSTAGGGFAIVGNTVTASNAGGYHVGVITGTTVNFTVTPSASLTSSGDFASCPLSLTFNSTITAAPNASITCTNSFVTLTSTAPSTITPVTYTWSGPGIITSVNNQTVNVNAAGVYTCTMSNASCPTRTATSTFTVISTVAPLSISVSPTPATKCFGGPGVTLTANGATNYTWTPSATLSSSVGASVIANPTVTTTYTIFGATGTCTGTTVKTVSVLPTPTVNITSGTPTICAGSSTNISASGATTYTWNPGSLTGATVSVNPASTTVYTVIGANGTCTSAATTTVVVSPGPTITATSSPTVICPGNTSTLSASGATTYTWNPGALTGANVVVTPTITTTYTVSGTGAFGCVSTRTVTLLVSSNPTITISPSSPSICVGSTTTLTASGVTNYTWLPGSVTTSTIAVSPVVNTTYTVLGTSGTCSGSNTVLVTVLANPTVTAVASPTAICLGSSATLSAGGATTYTWNPGSLTGANVVVSPTISTTYTLIGANGICTNTRTLNLVVNPNPTVTASASPTNICSGAATTVTLTGTGATNYTWNPGGLTGATTTVSPASTTNYTVSGANAFGCTRTATVTVSVTPTPTLNATATPTAICVGSSATLAATGATTYSWNPGALTGGSVVVSPTVSTTYTISGANGICISTRTLSLIVNPNPTVTAVASPTAICSGNSTTLTANGAVSYTWNPGGLTGTSVTVSPVSTTVYTVTGANATGCRSTRTVTVQVTPTPTLNATASPTAICVGSSATLTATGATTYSWNPGALTGSSVVVTPTASTTYTVSGANGLCLSTRTLNLIVNPNPTVTAVASPTAICSGSSTTLTASGAVTYSWNPGALTGTSVVVSPTVNTTYTVTGASATGCRSTRTVSIVVNPNPTVTASASPTNICSGAATTVTLTGTGATNYTWNPGGLTGATTTVSPVSTTNYTVSGANAFGCTRTATVTVSVTPTPTLNATATPTAICVGSSATLTATGATTYSWNPGALTGGSVVVSPTVSTTYTISGANGICISTRTLSLIVNPNPTVTAVASPTAICSGNSTTLTANGAVSYTWNPGGLTGTSVTVSPVSTTVYTVTGANASGCTRTATVTVSVTPTPTLNATASPTAICVGSSATLTATGATTYSWNPGALTGTSVVVTPTTSTTYTVRGANGICTSTRTINLVVNPLPTVAVVASPTAICSGSSTTLTASGAVTYSWNPGALTGTSVVVSPTVNTTYTVTGASATGCRNTRTVSIVVNPNPTVTASASPTNICSGAATTVTLTGTGATNYTWNPGGLTGATTTVSPASTTVYTVTGANATGCRSTRTVTVQVTPTPTLTATSNPTAICVGSSATLAATGATTYSWNPGALTGGSVVVTPTTSTTYTVRGANGICISTRTLSLIVNPNPTVTAVASPTAICSGNSTTLTANGAVSYTWNPGGLTGTSVTVSPVSTTVYTVTGANATGCRSTRTVTVQVTPTPTLNATASPTAICVGSSATLTATGATTYSWNPGALTGTSVVVTPTTSTTYTVRGANGICTSTRTINLVVNPLPTVAVVASPTAICSGSSTTLTASGAVTYSWNPGALTGTSVVVSPTVNTTYTVTGASATGCRSTRTVSIVVNPNPTVTATASSTNICSGAATTVTLSSSGAATYTWNPGGLTGATTTVSPASTTVYTVTGANATGCRSTRTVTVQVTPTPTLTAISNPTAICVGSSATLAATGASTYSWNPGVLTGTSLVVSPTVSTTYTLTGANGICTSTRTLNLVVNSNPTVTAVATSTAICAGNSTTLTANGATTYSWNPGSLTGTTLAITPTVSTTYTVIGTNSVGCSSQNTVAVAINALPSLSIASTPTAICIGETTTLTASGASTYTWNTGSVTGTTYTANPASTSIYTLSGTNSNGCIASLTTTVNVSAVPSITATASQSLMCLSSLTSVTLTANGATNYTWSPIAISGSVAVDNPTTTTVYTVTGNNGACNVTSTVAVLVINCNNSVFGITKAASKPLLVNGDYQVTYTVTAVNASTLNLTNITLEENLSNTFPLPTTFIITNPPVITSQNSSLTINPLFDGKTNISLTNPATSTLTALKRDTIVFTVKVTPNEVYCPFKNTVIGYATQFGSIVVSDSSNNGFIWDPDGDGDPTNNDTMTVVCFPELNLEIPTGFSPNGDNVNDLFVIKGLNGRKVKLTVYNRWGNKVYENNEYDNSWNGTVNISSMKFGQEKLPQATYFYIIEFLDGEQETFTGYVILQY